MTDTIHAHLAQKDLLPGEHLLDAGYVDAGNLATAQQDHAVALIGPVALDTSWQAKTRQGFDIPCFTIDWEAHAVTCAQGQRSRLWSPGQDAYGNEIIDVYFATARSPRLPHAPAMHAGSHTAPPPQVARAGAA